MTDNIDNFSKVMGQIDDLCFEYDECLEEYINRMSEDEFYYWVKNRYRELQKSVISSNNLAYEHLIYRSYQTCAMSGGIIGLLSGFEKIH